MLKICKENELLNLYIPDKDKLCSIDREFLLVVRFFFTILLIYSKNKEIWNLLVQKTIDTDDLNNQSRYKNYNISIEKNFAEKISNFNTLKRYRKNRTRIYKLEKNKVISKSN